MVLADRWRLSGTFYVAYEYTGANLPLGVFSTRREYREALGRGTYYYTKKICDRPIRRFRRIDPLVQELIKTKTEHGYSFRRLAAEIGISTRTLVQWAHGVYAPPAKQRGRLDAWIKGWSV